MNIGLTSEEAIKRLSSYGPNEVSPSRAGIKILESAKFFLDPMGLMLLGLAALYAALGDKADSIILLAAWLPVTAVDVVLELRASSALRALRATLSPVAKVLRDNVIREIPIRELVPGDALLFEEGQGLPADGKLIEAEHLSIDEAALTGESVPVDKSMGMPFYGGTQVVTGRAIGIVEKTGRHTHFGHIAHFLGEVERVASPLKKKVDRLVRQVLIAAGTLAIFLFFLEVYRNKNAISSLIVALTFGMSAVPEEFPLVFTLYLSLGAWRLSRKRILVKSLPSVETLGSADILCTDKTGTLTEGRYQLEEIHPFAGEGSDSLWTSALMACETHPVDSLEAAIFEKGRAHLSSLAGWRLVWDYPFEKRGKHMTHVWRYGQSPRHRVVMKGAIEGVLEHCNISDQFRSEIETQVKTLASLGKRLLGLAYREGETTGDRSSDERGLRFVGILVFSDPVRLSARDAIQKCQVSGIEVKMLTGDHPFTAHSIADQVGMKHSHDLMFTGDELAKLDTEQRRQAYLKGAVFSRVLPEQKHEMVKALQASGKVVAMTGDGINDAPALKLADVGISMGHSATDVARSAAQIVLLDSDFSGIVATMLEGKRILANLKRSFSYLISFHVPVVALTLFPPLLGWPALLQPIHIILLELVVHPVSAFTFENMPLQSQRVAGQRAQNLLDRQTVLTSTSAGLLVSIGALLSFGWLVHHGPGPGPGSGPALEASARTVGFAAILVGNIAFVLSEAWPAIGIRAWFTTLCLAGFVTLLMLSQVSLLHLSPVTPLGAALAILSGASGLLPCLLRSGAKTKVISDTH